MHVLCFFIMLTLILYTCSMLIKLFIYMRALHITLYILFIINGIKYTLYTLYYIVYI